MSRYTVLNRNGDFVRIYRRGKSQVHPLLVTYILRNRSNCPRVGITATKKVGGAVQRNRAKRVIRAAYASLGYPLPPGYDVVFVARGRTTLAKSTQISEVMSKQLDALLPPSKGGKQ